jgi:hypothetical protein
MNLFSMVPNFHNTFVAATDSAMPVIRLTFGVHHQNIVMFLVWCRALFIGIAHDSVGFYQFLPHSTASALLKKK